MWNLGYALSALGVLVVLANSWSAVAETGQPPPPAPTRQESLLRGAVRQLQEPTTLRIMLRQRSEFFDHAVTGSGSYLQRTSPRGLLFKMEWKLAVDDQVTTLQQISDGRFLWLRRDLSEETRLSRIDLARVQDEWSGAAAEPESLLRFPALALGGLPRLLLEFEEHFVFPQAPRSGQLGEMPVWVLRGGWKPDSLRRLWPQRVASSTRGDSRPALPPHVPTHVQIVLEQPTLMPRRIDYLRELPPGNSGSAGEPVHQFRRLLTVEMLEIVRGEPLDETLFFFQPGEGEVIDQTDHYLQNRNRRP